MGARDMLAEARRWLGTSGRPNGLTRAYARRHGDVFLRAPWCDIAVTEWARRSGNAHAVLPAGDRAYTVWHAGDFQKIGRWRTGTAANVRKYARPGDIVFFDWAGSNRVGAIDHVGVVERNLSDGRVQTIEANTSDACKRRIRGPGVIAGFGQPAYTTSASTSMTGEEDMIGLEKGDKGVQVKLLQAYLVYAGYLTSEEVDGAYGPKTAAAVLRMRKDQGSEADSGDRFTYWARVQLDIAIAKRHGRGERGPAGPPGPQGPPGEAPPIVSVSGELAVNTS